MKINASLILTLSAFLFLNTSILASQEIHEPLPLIEEDREFIQMVDKKISMVNAFITGEVYGDETGTIRFPSYQKDVHQFYSENPKEFINSIILTDADGDVQSFIRESQESIITRVSYHWNLNMGNKGSLADIGYDLALVYIGMYHEGFMNLPPNDSDKIANINTLKEFLSYEDDRKIANLVVAECKKNKGGHLNIPLLEQPIEDSFKTIIDVAEYKKNKDEYLNMPILDVTRNGTFNFLVRRSIIGIKKEGPARTPRSVSYPTHQTGESWDCQRIRKILPTTDF